MPVTAILRKYGSSYRWVLQKNSERHLCLPNLYEYGRPALRWPGDIEDRIASSVRKLVKSVGKSRSNRRVQSEAARL
jgi:hypothetical protein